MGGIANKLLLEAMELPDGVGEEAFFAQHCPPLQHTNRFARSSQVGGRHQAVVATTNNDTVITCLVRFQFSLTESQRDAQSHKRRGTVSILARNGSCDTTFHYVSFSCISVSLCLRENSLSDRTM